MITQIINNDLIRGQSKCNTTRATAVITIKRLYRFSMPLDIAIPGIKYNEQ